MGGAPQCVKTPPGHLHVEVITAGHSYAPDTGLKCGAGWVFAHRPGQDSIHYSDPDDHYECLSLRFSDIPKGELQTWPRAFLWKDLAAILTFSQQTLYAFHRIQIAPDIIAAMAWHQLCFQRELGMHASKAPSLPSAIRLVIHFIDEHYASPITLDDLAALAKISSSHLHARFRQAMGMTPHQSLIQVRLSAARHLLVTTNTPIKAIADDVGYTSTEHFCRAFKRLTGSTAATYRSTHAVLL